MADGYWTTKTPKSEGWYWAYDPRCANDRVRIAHFFTRCGVDCVEWDCFDETESWSDAEDDGWLWWSEPAGIEPPRPWPIHLDPERYEYPLPPLPELST